MQRVWENFTANRHRKISSQSVHATVAAVNNCLLGSKLHGNRQTYLQQQKQQHCCSTCVKSWHIPVPQRSFSPRIYSIYTPLLANVWSLSSTDWSAASIIILLYLDRMSVFLWMSTFHTFCSFCSQVALAACEKKQKWHLKYNTGSCKMTDT